LEKSKELTSEKITTFGIKIKSKTMKSKKKSPTFDWLFLFQTAFDTSGLSFALFSHQIVTWAYIF